MPDSLSDLEQRREVLAQRIAELGDLRPGSITGTSGRCGKPECHCHQAGRRVMAPISGSPIRSMARPSRKRCPPLRRSRKPSEKVEEFRKFQQLTREFLGTNAEICRLRPLDEKAETERKKKRSKRSGKKSRAK